MKENGSSGFNNLIKGMFSPLLSPSSRIASIAQLLLAEEILDELASHDDCNLAYWQLYARTEAYVRANPELLRKPWLRNGGAVRDIIAQINAEDGPQFLRLAA
jgi:hypothetical protein